MDQELAERQIAKAENMLNRTTNKLAGTPGEEKREWFQTPKQRFDEKARLAVSEEAMNNGKPAKGQKRKGGKEDGRESKKKRAEKTPEEMAEERVRRELEKVALVQAKYSKAKTRLNKLRAHDEDDNPKRGPAPGPGKKEGKKDRVQRSNFATDLTDVSAKGAKKFRHQATKAQNEFARNKARGRPPGGSGGRGGRGGGSGGRGGSSGGRGGGGGSSRGPPTGRARTSSVKITNKAGMNKFNKGKNFGAPKQKRGRK